MRTKSFFNRPVLAIGLSLVVAIVFVLVLSNRFTSLSTAPQTAHAQSANLGTLSGYAWSDNVGWISFSGGNYQVVVQSDGTLAGYAWANPSDDTSGTNNIGWIDFNAADTAGCGFGAAKLTGTTITGGALVVAADNNGWNGCISLSGSSPSYGVTLNSTGSSQSGTLDGYAWADNTVGGWISFNCDTGGPAANTICATSNYAVTYTTNTPPPPLVAVNTFVGSPPRVRTGSTGTLLYNVTSQVSCTITGNDGSSYPVTADSTQHSVTTNPITKNTLYTLACGTIAATATIGPLPAYQEK